MSREEDEANTSTTTVSTWRHSFQGFFRGTLVSPERTLRTGTAHVATAAVLRPSLPQSNSSKTSFNTANSGLLGVARLVKVSDFADSDTSSSSVYTAEEIRSAESIYLIIQGYEDAPYFRFDENFDASTSSESFHDVSETRDLTLHYSPERPQQKELSSQQLPQLSSQRSPQLPSQQPSQRLPQRSPHRPLPGLFTTPISPPSEVASYPEPSLTPTARYPGGAADVVDTGDILGVLQEEPLAAGSIFSGRHNNTQRAPRNSDVFSDDHGLSLNQSFFDAHTGLTSPKALTTNTDNSEFPDSPSLPHGDALLSSGELLHKLDSSVRLSASGYPRHLVLGLTAGVDSQSELPVMLYTVHDRDSHNTRWSVYEERRKRLARPTVPAPTYPGIRSGLNSGRSVSLSSQSSLGDGNMRSSPTFAAPRAGEIGSASSHYASLNAGSNLDSSKGFNGSNGSNGFNGSNKDSNGSNGSNGSNRYPGAANSGSSNDVSSPGSLIIRSVATPSARNSAVPKQVTMQLPSDTVLQDTLSKQEYHKAMYINDSDQQLDATYTQEVELGTSSVPWSRWAVMMVMGLVAVPVLFMISFGFFDYGGHHDYSLTRSIDNEKKGDVQMRYFQRYTPLQKMLSFALGVFWILVVLAMIGVGFGLGISRE